MRNLLLVATLLLIGKGICQEEFLERENVGIDPTIITGGELIFPALGSNGMFFKYEEVLPNVSNQTYDYLQQDSYLYEPDLVLNDYCIKY